MSNPNYRRINRDLLATMNPPGGLYYVSLVLVLAVLAWGIYAWVYQIKTGLGVAGINRPVGWGIYITNFVFWVGIAHSGPSFPPSCFWYAAAGATRSIAALRP